MRCRLWYRAFPDDPGSQKGIMPDEDKARVAAMPLEELLAEVRAASVSGKKASAVAAAGQKQWVGTSFHKSTHKWQAYLKHHGRIRALGYFHSPENAARAYDAAAFELYGRC